MALPEPAIPREIGQSFDLPSSTEVVPVAPDRPIPDFGPRDIVQILEGYRTEAEYARLSGPNSRDMTWLQNLDLYWNRFDFSHKASWQAREILPEFPQYVDRFAAALRTALMSGTFFSVSVHNDTERAVADVIRKLMKVVLARIGRSNSGHRVDFLVTFEEAMKYGALMMPVTLVTSEKVDGIATTTLENVDAYNVWYDPTGRGLYRIRRLELDLHSFQHLAALVDGEGKPLYEIEEIKAVGSTAASMQASMEALQRAEREKRTGTGQWQTSTRRPIILYEFYGTIIDPEGNTLGENVLAIWANGTWLVRGPESNPFLHGRDWLVSGSILPVPGAPYGRAYVENFAAIAKTLNELTNLLLDGIFTSAMKAFAVVPSYLEDPTQLEEGIYPNVTFRLVDGALPKDFIQPVDLGQISQQALAFWQALKKELQEGAAFNDLSLGNLASHSRTSATEIGTAEQNSNSLIKSIASNIECLYLEPLLDIIWKTTIQYLDPKDSEIEEAVGKEWFQALLKGKKEFAKTRVKFVVRGISSLILKQQKLQQLMQYLQVIAGNQQLAQVFLQDVDLERLNAYVMGLFEIEQEEFMKTPQQKQIEQLQQIQQQRVEQQQLQRQALMDSITKVASSAARPTGAQRGGKAGPQPSAGAGGGQAVPAGAGPPAAAGIQLPVGAGGVR